MDTKDTGTVKYEGSAEDIKAAASAAFSDLKLEDLASPEDGQQQTDEGEPEGSTPDDEPAANDAPAEPVEEEFELESPEAPTEDQQQEDESEPVETKADKDYDHYWNQYKTEDARKRALHETKEYASRLSREAKQLKAELETVRAKAEPKPEPKAAEPELPPAERLKKTLEMLNETDPSVRDRVAGLGQLKGSIDSETKELSTVETDLRTLASAIFEKNATLKYLREKAKASPDDLEIREEIRNIEFEVSDARARQNELRITKSELRVDIKTKVDTYNADVKDLYGVAAAHQEKEAAQASEAKAIEELTADIKTKWEDALRRVATEQKIPQEELEDINDLLRDRAYSVSDKIDPDKLYEWMTTEGLKPILSIRKRTQERQVAEYSALKRKDAAQPAPKATISKTESEKPAPISMQDFTEAKARELKAELRKSGGRFI